MVTQNIIGVDIAKNWIDVHNLQRGQHQRIAMETKALQGFVKKLPKDSHIIFEASGGYERPLQDMLITHKLAYSRINPRQAREFARATGALAKTDKVDAKMLAKMGQALQLAPTPPPCLHRQYLAALVARREDLVRDKVAETNRLKQARDSFICRDIKSHITVLMGRIAKVDAEIKALISKTKDLALLDKQLQSAQALAPSQQPASSRGCQNWAMSIATPLQRWRASPRMLVKAVLKSADAERGAGAKGYAKVSIKRPSSPANMTPNSKLTENASQRMESPSKSPSSQQPESSSHS